MTPLLFSVFFFLALFPKVVFLKSRDRLGGSSRHTQFESNMSLRETAFFQMTLLVFHIVCFVGFRGGAFLKK